MFNCFFGKLPGLASHFDIQCNLGELKKWHRYSLYFPTNVSAVLLSMAEGIIYYSDTVRQQMANRFVY
jgi:hypothetical protein